MIIAIIVVVVVVSKHSSGYGALLCRSSLQRKDVAAPGLCYLYELFSLIMITNNSQAINKIQRAGALH